MDLTKVVEEFNAAMILALRVFHVWTQVMVSDAINVQTTCLVMELNMDASSLSEFKENVVICDMFVKCTFHLLVALMNLVTTEARAWEFQV